MTAHSTANPNSSGVRHKWRLLAFVMLIAIAASTLTYFIVKDTLDKTTEHQALIIAEIVARQAAAGRTVYSQDVVNKLKRDGYGSDIHSDKRPGFVPLPAQFLKLMGRESSRSNADLYRYKPISKWHLEPTQGLNDNFENWAWQQLQAQDQANPSGPIDWKPAWWTEEWQGKRYFRYMRADPASSESCVTCHNQYLQQPAIIAQLKSEGVTGIKQWKLNQLMGAISVTIPMAKIEHIAVTELRQTIVWTSTILITALIIIGGIFIANTNPGLGKQKFSRHETHDKVTGLLNLIGLELTLSAALDSAKQQGLNHAFICLKLVDTHAIQDRLGRESYNHFRNELASHISNTLRHDDTLGWLSHDKLGILIHDCQSLQAKKIADQLRDAAVNFRVRHEQSELQVGVTISLAMISADTLSVSSIIKTTDRIDYETAATTVSTLT